MRVEALTGDALQAVLEDVAALRIAVFREWPYLYDGDVAYERRYLRSYRDNPRAIVVGAFDGDQLVGAATGVPLTDHEDDFATPLQQAGIAGDQVFYCAESVLLPAYRGQGIGHRFFDLREAQARALGARYSSFCAVVRPDDHPLRPSAYRPLDAFWRKRGYAPMPGVMAHFAWKDVDQAAESDHVLQFWIRELER
ncbi:MAG: GNAT family N-acetyltransferase [Paracoccaceae bacterium]|nr:GNAT family N-acetyltransferase [Paracoccaceae bacterium]